MVYLYKLKDKVKKIHHLIKTMQDKEPTKMLP